jgi:hypothetical protein
MLLRKVGNHLPNERRHNTEGDSINTLCCEDLKSYNYVVYKLVRYTLYICISRARHNSLQNGLVILRLTTGNRITMRSRIYKI